MSAAIKEALDARNIHPRGEGGNGNGGHGRWDFHYKHFKDAQPPMFNGVRDPVKITCWISDIEGAFRIAKCPLEKKTSRANTSLFVFKKDSCVIYLLVYVDDIILAGNNDSLLHFFISRLHKKFHITDLGKLSYFLGLEVSYRDSDIFLSQPKYAHEILARAQLMDIKHAAMPLLVSAYFTSHVSFFMCPIQEHLSDVKRILRYVKGTFAYGLSFLHSPSPNIPGHSDADWAHCIETQRSTYGYSIFFSGNLVSWCANKQPTVSRYTCESEYRALANTAAEII
ncbi:uncharacterized mitochondrial protein AtMg00810-like [Rutidosis leptorrhynchoides]|uniref:uncharacterized mitochondrial protein AtMg00810-like n=1 Tax=Rutidosis leptorrhynchoides TaxID=125765 RepID=UPI003A9999C4